MTKIFLGGTCNESSWRDKLISLLKIEYFNPVITNREWTEEDRQNEIKMRKECDLVLYTFTPRMTGLYSIAEVVDDSNKKPTKTFMCVLSEDTDDSGKRIVFTKNVTNSLKEIALLVKANGGLIFDNLENLAENLNGGV